MSVLTVWSCLLLTTVSAFHLSKGRKAVLAPMGMSYPYLHLAEYPTDDFRHILGYNDPSHTMSKLQEISSLRIQEVVKNKTPVDTEGCGLDKSFYVTSDDLLGEIREFDEIYGKPLNITEKMRGMYPKMAIAAEFKRASPSKGEINMHVDVVQQCLQYADMNAAIISVLTEYRHFKGVITDMKKVRLATQEAKGKLLRPAILRKDFIFDRYQILEARANGADTVLLIVAVLGQNQLKDLIEFSRKVGMEPLVEVHTDEEMRIALSSGAQVIGINNRNLHNFQLDLDTTRRVLSIAQSLDYEWNPSSMTSDLCMMALSGITNAEDVNTFRKLGISCCLIGETLMKSSDPKETIAQLLQEDLMETSTKIVKLCGMTRPEDVQIALQHQVNLVGLIFAPKSKRRVDVSVAKTIVDRIQKYGERNQRIPFTDKLQLWKAEKWSTKEWFECTYNEIQKLTIRKPLAVGVFQDQSTEEVNRMVSECDLDLVQLHGQETPEYLKAIQVPCIKVLHIPIASEGQVIDYEKLREDIDRYAFVAVGILLDSSVVGRRGGTGSTFDWTVTNHLDDVPVMLAGGLQADSVREALGYKNVIGVDASSGVEVSESSAGVKDEFKMRDFFANARKIDISSTTR